MKISIERNSFLNSLSHVQNIVEKRNTIPILSNILIDAHSNNLILSATDMDVSVTEAINCNVIEQGSVTTLPTLSMILLEKYQKEMKLNSFLMMETNFHLDLVNQNFHYHVCLRMIFQKLKN